jgi:hypothetical protein
VSSAFPSSCRLREQHPKTPSAFWVIAAIAAAALLVVASHLYSTSDDLVAAYGPASPYVLPNGAQAYGPAINADTLANTQVGGTDCSCPAPGTRVSYRFRATSDTLMSIRIFIQDGAGYGAGTGGVFQIELQADDGSSVHAPTGASIATVQLSPGNPVREHFPLIAFAPAVRLTPGVLYHVVFSNADRFSAANFQSLNALHTSHPGSLTQPRYLDLDWAQLINVGKGWSARSGYAPVLQLSYGNGAIDGVGYMEVWVNNPKLVTAQSAIRETILVSGGDKRVESLWTRVRHTGGAGGLQAILERVDSTIVDQSLASADRIPGTYTWVQFEFPKHPVLVSGSTYRLVLAATESAQFESFPIRRGLSYGFRPASVFADGYAEFQDGTDWRVWASPSGGGRKEGDLQFYFVLFRPRDSGAFPPAQQIANE